MQRLTIAESTNRKRAMAAHGRLVAGRGRFDTLAIEAGGGAFVVKTGAGEIMVKELARRTARKVELDSLDPEHPGRALAARDIAWLSRIVWVSQ